MVVSSKQLAATVSYRPVRMFSLGPMLVRQERDDRSYGFRWSFSSHHYLRVQGKNTIMSTNPNARIDHDLQWLVYSTVNPLSIDLSFLCDMHICAVQLHLGNIICYTNKTRRS